MMSTSPMIFSFFVGKNRIASCGHAIRSYTVRDGLFAELRELCALQGHIDHQSGGAEDKSHDRIFE